MGLTIHYAARLKDLDLLPQFVTEVEDICNTLGWKNRRVDDIFEMEDKNYTFLFHYVDTKEYLDIFLFSFF